MTPVEAVERLNAVIRIQSDVIDELFLDLMQHITAEEADTLPVIKRINEAAALRADMAKEGREWL